METLASPGKAGLELDDDQRTLKPDANSPFASQNMSASPDASLSWTQVRLMDALAGLIFVAVGARGFAVGTGELVGLMVGTKLAWGWKDVAVG